MPLRNAPPFAEGTALTRKRMLLRFTIAALLVSALAVSLLPLRLPWPLRLAVAGTDVIAALVVFVALRQTGSRS